MASIPVIAIFDIGKTNKKFLLFDSNYQVVYEYAEKLGESVDEDGYPCENLEQLINFTYREFNKALGLEEFDIMALNFSAYGASFVYLDASLKTIAPLYNYLKPFPKNLEQQFIQHYGNTNKLSLQTASPWLGSLNAGLQLYRLKYQKTELLSRLQYALHLPQFLSFLFTKTAVSDITSIGCHTILWDFTKNNYHSWVEKEGLLKKLPEIVASDTTMTIQYQQHSLVVGIGLHDSSAALIPYLMNYKEPFILLSTGTWCISMNPFNNEPLTSEELEHDCLCYMNFKGKPVKASRLFSGHEHEIGVQELARYFNKEQDYYLQVRFNAEFVNGLIAASPKQYLVSDFASYEEAYHGLIWKLVQLQKFSTGLVIGSTCVKQIFVDGGFSQNTIYMNMLAIVMSEAKVYAASMPQGSAIGAAMVIHSNWNDCLLPNNLIELKNYSDRMESTNLRQ